MRLGQIRLREAVTAAVFDGESARPIPGHTVRDLIRRTETEHTTLAELAKDMASRHAENWRPILPIHPAEVWSCGCTYEVALTEDRDTEPIYEDVYQKPRPEIFFKGGARVCVGPGDSIGIRADSKFTVPEPELALVLGPKGKVLAYTLANDVSAWDIEHENPLYLPQSKVYNASCALGPVLITADELQNPYSLQLTCTIRRAGETIFTAVVSTEKLHRRVETLIEYLYRANSVPAGSVLLTGTGVTITRAMALQSGDVVSIRVPEIGELSNPANIVE